MTTSKKKQRYLAYGSVLGISLIIILLLNLLPQRAESGEFTIEETIRDVHVRSFTPGPFETEIRITGRVRSVNRIELFSEVQGVLLSGDQPFRTGNRFRQGQVIVKLDDSEIALELAAMHSRFQSAVTALLPVIRLDFPSRFETWANFAESIQPGEPLPELPEITDRTERFFISGNDIFGQFFAIRAMETRVGKFIIKAPFNGELRMADTFPGTLVTPGVRLGEFFGDTYELETFVSLRELNYLEVGSRVELHSMANSNPLSGRVSRISRSIDPATQAFPVFVEVSSPILRDGLYLEGRITGRTLQDVAQIPRHLLTRENTVMVIENGIAVHREVEPVFFNSETVLVRGINASDQLIELRAGTTRLAGSRVRAIEN